MMRSIPFAIGWEILWRNRWILPANLLAANILPILIYSLFLFNEGNPGPLEPSWIQMHLAFFQIGLCQFFISLEGTHATLARLYAYPISNRLLVTCHVVPAMLLSAAFALISAVLLNFVFDVHWPLLGSTLFAAALTAAGLAALWQTTHTLGRLFLAICVFIVACLWHKSRYGSLWHSPIHMWQDVNLVEVLTLLSVTVLAFYIAVRGVARCRRGDELANFGLLKSIETRFARTAKSAPKFRSPSQALFWYEWRQKGWAMPAFVVFGSALMSLPWLIFSADLEELFTGMLAGSGMLVVVGLCCGIVLGVSDFGLGKNAFEMGPWMASRPIDCNSMAKAILRTAAASFAIAWSIWALECLLVFGLLAVLNRVSSTILPRDFAWWHYPLLLVGSWVTYVTAASILLTNRSKQITVGLISVVAIGIGLGFLEANESVRWAHLLRRLVVDLAGPALMLASAGAFVAAYRKSLITSNSILFAFLLWIAISSPVMVAWLAAPRNPASAYTLVLGLLAWAVAPIAVMPLAISWNRVH